MFERFLMSFTSTGDQKATTCMQDKNSNHSPCISISHQVPLRSLTIQEGNIKHNQQGAFLEGVNDSAAKIVPDHRSNFEKSCGGGTAAEL